MKEPRTADHILYLDFDGVLHDEAVYCHPRRGIYLAKAGHSLFEWMPILEGLLAPHPAYKIVLSTSWVRVRSFNFARDRLSAGLQKRVIGATFHRREMRKDEFAFLSRGVQIANDVSRREPVSWFALDDDDTEWPPGCRGNLIKTNGDMGISDPTIQEAVRVMLERNR